MRPYFRVITSLFLLTAVSIQNASAQESWDPESQANCKGMVEESSKTLVSYEPEDVAKRVLSKITNSINLKPNFQILPANVYIAKACTLKRQRYIFYDREIFENLANGETNWEGWIVIAHELAHHFNGDALESNKTTHEFELAADEFSGSMMQLLGADKDEVIRFYNELPEKATETHPDRYKRLQAFLRGFNSPNARSEPVSEKLRYLLNLKLMYQKNTEHASQQGVEGMLALAKQGHVNAYIALGGYYKLENRSQVAISFFKRAEKFGRDDMGPEIVDIAWDVYSKSGKISDLRTAKSYIDQYADSYPEAQCKQSLITIFAGLNQDDDEFFTDIKDAPELTNNFPAVAEMLHYEPSKVKQVAGAITDLKLEQAYINFLDSAKNGSPGCAGLISGLYAFTLGEELEDFSDVFDEDVFDDPLAQKNLNYLERRGYTSIGEFLGFSDPFDSEEKYGRIALGIFNLSVHDKFYQLIEALQPVARISASNAQLISAILEIDICEISNGRDVVKLYFDINKIITEYIEPQYEDFDEFFENATDNQKLKFIEEIDEKGRKLERYDIKVRQCFSTVRTKSLNSEYSDFIELIDKKISYSESAGTLSLINDFREAYSSGDYFRD